MGYISFIVLTAAVLVILGAIFFARARRTDRGNIGPHVTPAQPYADEATPDRSSISSRTQVENAKRETPPA